MFRFLALGTGVLLAIMIQINGTLSGQYGTYHAALYIHIIGACAAALLLLLRHKPIRAKSKVSFWMLTGGVIGVGTTVFNNLAFSHISLTCIVALQLFAELLVSCLIDAFGLFGMQRRGRGEWSIAGMLLSVAGIALMLDSPAAGAWIYVLMSMGAGVTVVLSRTVNAHLSDRIGALPGTLVNHLAGMPVCLLLMLLLPETGAGGAFRPWTWCGGLLGVGSTDIHNDIGRLELAAAVQLAVDRHTAVYNASARINAHTVAEVHWDINAAHTADTQRAVGHDAGHHQADFIHVRSQQHTRAA